MNYKEYRNEVPLNTVRSWYDTLLKELPWEYVGWSGAPKEPLRHWAAYPSMEGVLKQIWDLMSESFAEDGLHLKPERIIANLFAHGDSSWLHRDCDKDNTWTAIIYLNDRWDSNWHGGTVIMDDAGESLAYFNPTPGKFVIFKSNLLHGPVPVSREAPYPRFGLAFQCGSNNLSGPKESKLSSISAAKF